MTNHKTFRESDDDRPSLSMDERIVWISDNGPEYGNIRWLGKLPDLGKEWMAGVEFDNPVGSGTGLYKDKQLFTTPLHHASLVPVIGLLKASDFDGPPEPPTRDSSTRLIDFDRSLISESRLESLDKQNEFRYDIVDAYSNRTKPQHLGSSGILREQSNSLQSKQQQVGRIRHIPIKVESDDKLINHKLENSDSIVRREGQLTSNNDKEYSTTGQDKSDLVHILTSALEHASLKSSGRATDISLPPPALVVSSGDGIAASNLTPMLGKSKGIQGYNNSCYLDATLFAMFSSTTLFDSLLYRPANRQDIPGYRGIQTILREDIVRPLREDNFVSADKVMLFRTTLEQSSSVEGLTDEEKDPEEFISLLLGQILKAEPYLKLSSGLESFLYQLIVDKDENVVLPTVQDLFDQSFVKDTVRLREIPPCLLMQMPRFGPQYKMYSRIMPSQKLDITDVLESAPRSCGHRGKDCDNIARFECMDCLHDQSGRKSSRLANITYCNNCFHSKHFGKSHITGIEYHDKTKTSLAMTPPEAIRRYSNSLCGPIKNKEIPRICMDLIAVLCIETSHYVCFVKCGPEPEAPWCFFDSMADRKGEQNGYNIPEVLLFDEFSFWMSDNGIAYLSEHKDDKLLPEMARRLICDAYLCFYQYNGLTFYR